MLWLYVSYVINFECFEVHLYSYVIHDTSKCIIRNLFYKIKASFSIIKTNNEQQKRKRALEDKESEMIKLNFFDARF